MNINEQLLNITYLNIMGDSSLTLANTWAYIFLGIVGVNCISAPISKCKTSHSCRFKAQE